jgi:hypothetical protein
MALTFTIIVAIVGLVILLEVLSELRNPRL